MDSILDFLEGIGETITNVVDFVISFFGDLIYVIQLTGKFLGQLPSYFSWLPSDLLTMLMILFGIVVIYKVLGREG